MRMQKRKFRIGELAQRLHVERFVIRFWEKEFNLKPSRSTGRQRFYDENDMTRFTQIKDLLYTHGFTIAGAKKQLQLDKKVKKSAKIIALQPTTLNPATHIVSQTENSTMEQALEQQRAYFEQQIMDLQKKLRRLRELL